MRESAVQGARKKTITTNKIKAVQSVLCVGQSADGVKLRRDQKVSQGLHCMALEYLRRGEMID